MLKMAVIPFQGFEHQDSVRYSMLNFLIVLTVLLITVVSIVLCGGKKKVAEPEKESVKSEKKTEDNSKKKIESARNAKPEAEPSPPPPAPPPPPPPVSALPTKPDVQTPAADKPKPPPAAQMDMVDKNMYGTMQIIDQKMQASHTAPKKPMGTGSKRVAKSIKAPSARKPEPPKEDKVGACAYGTMLGIDNKMVASNRGKTPAAAKQNAVASPAQVAAPPAPADKVGVGQYGTMLAVQPGALKASVVRKLPAASAAPPTASPPPPPPPPREDKVAANLYGTMMGVEGKMTDSKRK